MQKKRQTLSSSSDREKAPDIYSYNDFRLYISDWQKGRQKVDPDFTRAEMSRRMGLPRTRGFVKDVVAGKKITPNFVERFVRVMELDSVLAQYFRSMVRFNQAETPHERELAFDQLVALDRVPLSTLDRKKMTYYRHWWNGAIRAMLSTQNLTKDPKRVASLLQPAITAKQARESLELLLELDLIETTAQGFLKPTELSISAPETAQKELLRQLQVHQLELIQGAAIRTAGQNLTIGTNVISVSSSGLEQVRRRLLRARNEIRNVVHKDQDKAEGVFLVAMALVPLLKQRVKE